MFSQGEWQLLSIARAAAADPAVLLLDEITANLDAATEARVLEALRRASRGRTVLSISHRIYESMGGRTIEIKSPHKISDFAGAPNRGISAEMQCGTAERTTAI